MASYGEKYLWAWNHIATFQSLNHTLHNVNPIFWHLCFILLSHTNQNLALLFQCTQVAIFHFQDCNSFFKFASTLLALVSKNKSNQNQKNWTHTMPMSSFVYGILAPLPSTSTWLPKLQLLSYVKTKKITHTHTPHKKVSFELQSQCFTWNSKNQVALFHFELHMVAPKPILSCNAQNEKKTLHVPWTHYNFSSLQIDMLLSHTQQNKNKNTSLHVHLLYAPLYSN